MIFLNNITGYFWLSHLCNFNKLHKEEYKAIINIVKKDLQSGSEVFIFESVCEIGLKMIISDKRPRVYCYVELGRGFKGLLSIKVYRDIITYRETGLNSWEIKQDELNKLKMMILANRPYPLGTTH